MKKRITSAALVAIMLICGISIPKTQATFTVNDGYKTIAAGYCASYAIKTDGSLWAWGNNGEGQLGTGTIDTNNSYVDN